MTTYHFTVLGRAIPQGSKRAFVNPKTGRAILTESSGKHRQWRDLVRLRAQDAERRPPVPIEGPVTVAVHFKFGRPKAHYHQRKTGPVLRADAPAWVTSRAIGDIDKLQRAVFDAITDAGWIRDDSQIADVVSTKCWSDLSDEVLVCVTPLNEAAA